jgi:hypothetical protein
LEPGTETVGTVIQTIKRSASSLVDSFVTRKTRGVMKELKLSYEISRITHLKVLNNVSLKNIAFHEDMRLNLQTQSHGFAKSTQINEQEICQ